MTGLLLGLLGFVAGMLSAHATGRLANQPFKASNRRVSLLGLIGAGIGIGSALWSASVSGSPWLGAFTALLGWQLLLIAIIDAENLCLPDILTLPLALTGVVANGLLEAPPAIGWKMAAISALAAFAILWGLAGLYQLVRRRKAMGAGDPILLGAGCAWVGLQDIVAVLLWSSLAAFFFVVVQKLRRQDVGLQSRLPFGTFLAIGVAVCWLTFSL